MLSAKRAPANCCHIRGSERISFSNLNEHDDPKGSFMKRPQQPERFGNQTLIRTKSSTRDGAVSMDTVLRKAGPAMTKAPRSHSTSPALQVSRSQASQALSRCLGSLRNPAQSNRLRTASRGSQCTGSCPGETTWSATRPPPWRAPSGLPSVSPLAAPSPGSPGLGCKHRCG